ncbi:MAG: hypothetical protein WC742_08295 [Gallionellaceae bacterium]|jgi:hypothetical protein
MFELPSMWNLVVSTIVFFIAAWYINRHLDEQEMPKDITRSLLVFLLAYVLSWGSGELVDWLQGPQAETETAQDLSTLLKQINP